MMNIGAWIEGILIIGVGLVAVAEGLRLIIYKDPYILYDPLGPGVYVLVLSLGLMATGIVHLISHGRSNPRLKGPGATREASVQVFSSVGVLVLYILLVHFVGYLPATLVFFFLELRIAGVRSWRSIVFFTLLLSGLYYFVFVRLCLMVFPKGILF
jgi:hypothetical protein